MPCAAPEVTNANSARKGWDHRKTCMSARAVVSARAMDLWNSLDEKAVTVETINKFKIYLGNLDY